jgi:hypothetical protein
MVDMAGFTSMTFGISTLPRAFKPDQSIDRKFSVTVPLRPTKANCFGGLQLELFSRAAGQKKLSPRRIVQETL